MKKERKTKSDWYTVRSKNGNIFYLEIFGVTPTTGHAIRLLQNGKELEIFHLDDLSYVKRCYQLEWLTTKDDQILEFTRQNILETSNQLHEEGLGISYASTINLTAVLVARRLKGYQK